MPASPLPEDVRALLRQPNPAVMATVAADGRPVTVATWYLLIEDDQILLSFDAGRARLKHLRADPRVSVTALAKDDWYTHVSVQGRVLSIEDDTDLRGTDRVARHYIGRAYPDRVRPRVVAVVEVNRWHGWGAVKPD